MKVGVLATTLAILLVGGPVLAGPASDSDSDGTFDVLDICSANALVPSPVACDEDNDGYGNGCDADFNNDGVIDGLDFNAPGTPAVDSFFECFTTASDPGLVGCDMNCDGVIDGLDFNNPGTAELDSFFELFAGPGVPGPSGLGCAGTVPCP